MKAKANIKSIITILPFFGLVLLLLLSPCKVRNYIQSELGVTQTKASNKSQTTISYSDCSSYEVALHTFVKEKYNPQQLPSITSKFNFFVPNYSASFFPSFKARNHSVLSIPLYILYQNFKDYL